MASCIPIPVVPFPTLPFPLTLGAALPSIAFDPTLCCKILPFPVATPPIPLPPLVFNPAVVATIKANLALMKAYFDAIPIKCPRE